MCSAAGSRVSLDVGELTYLHRPVEQGVDPEIEGTLEPTRTDGLVAADHESRAVVRKLLEEEAPETFDVVRRSWLGRVEGAPSQIAQTAQTQESIRFELDNFPGIPGPIR